MNQVVEVIALPPVLDPGDVLIVDDDRPGEVTRGGIELLAIPSQPLSQQLRNQGPALGASADIAAVPHRGILL